MKNLMKIMVVVGLALVILGLAIDPKPIHFILFFMIGFIGIFVFEEEK